MAATKPPEPETKEGYWRKVYVVILGFELLVVLLLYWFTTATA